MEIYQYTDYRKYLQDAYQELKAKKKSFSFRSFSLVAGCGSPSYLKMVIDGKRNLSLKSLVGFNKALGHAKKEARYFEALVFFNQARGDEERKEFLDRLNALRPKPELSGIEKYQQEYLTRSHFAVIREMIALPDFKEDYEWIAHHLRPAIKPKEAEYAIELLTKLKMIKRDPKGKLVQTEASIGTPPEVHDLDVSQYHHEMLTLAWDSFLKEPQEYRDITAVTVPIPLKMLPVIKRMLYETMRGIIDKINKGPTDYYEVYQINFQCFPMTTTHDRMKK